MIEASREGEEGLVPRAVIAMDEVRRAERLTTLSLAVRRTEVGLSSHRLGSDEVSERPSTTRCSRLFVVIQGNRKVSRCVRDTL